jgi:hypothetical protein
MASLNVLLGIVPVNWSFSAGSTTSDAVGPVSFLFALPLSSILSTIP